MDRTRADRMDEVPIARAFRNKSCDVVADNPACDARGIPTALNAVA